MIFGSMHHEKTYGKLPKEILACFQYARDYALADREKGSYPIDGERFYVNIAEYEPCAREDRFWEAHKKYIDVHLLLSGSERIDVGFIENMRLKPYEEKDDFLPLDGSAQAYADLTRPGDFLVCYPEDAHRTGVRIGSGGKLKKAIFKVLIE